MNYTGIGIISTVVLLSIVLIVVITVTILKSKNKIKKPFFIPKSTTKIHLWHGEKDGLFTFMYSPVILSIKEVIKTIYPHVEINYKSDYYEWEDIKPTDTLIWVGEIVKPDFNYFKDKNIYTVYYNTEPYIENVSSDEIWTYSRYMFNLHSQEYKQGNQIIRYIPILCEKNVPSVPYLFKESPMNLIFMGAFYLRKDKISILKEYPLIKDNLLEVFNLWNDRDFTTFVSSKPHIYLNVTKTNNVVLPSFRLNKLLSHRCIIISNHTNPLDEVDYKDLIIFCDLREMESEYKKLLELSNEELHQKSNQIYKKFYSRFTLKNAMKRVLQKTI